MPRHRRRRDHGRAGEMGPAAAPLPAFEIPVGRRRAALVPGTELCQGPGPEALRLRQGRAAVAPRRSQKLGGAEEHLLLRRAAHRPGAERRAHGAGRDHAHSVVSRRGPRHGGDAVGTGKSRAGTAGLPGERRPSQQRDERQPRVDLSLCSGLKPAKSTLDQASPNARSRCKNSRSQRLGGVSARDPERALSVTGSMSELLRTHSLNRSSGITAVATISTRRSCSQIFAT